MKNIYVCYVADKNVESSLWISIYSLVESTNNKNKYTIFILDAGINTHFIKRILKKYKKIRHIDINFIKSQNNLINNIPSPRNVGRAVYHKLIIPKYIPSHIEKIVYLDTDTLVMEDIKHLYQYNTGSNVLLGVQEYFAPLISQTGQITGLLDIVDFPDRRHNYNSGVLLINLNRWRETNVTRRSISLLLDYYDRLTVDDQDALNGTVIDEWDTLSPSWNVQINCLVEEHKTIKYDDLIGSVTHSDLFDAPRIIHFNHHPKPVDLTYRGPFRNLYISYEISSGYFSVSSARLRQLLHYVVPTVASTAADSETVLGTIMDYTRTLRHRLARNRHTPRFLKRLLKRHVD